MGGGVRAWLGLKVSPSLLAALSETHLTVPQTSLLLRKGNLYSGVEFCRTELQLGPQLERLLKRGRLPLRKKRTF